MDAPVHFLEDDERLEIENSVENCLFMFRLMVKALDRNDRLIKDATGALMQVCDSAYNAGYENGVQQKPPYISE